MSKEKERLEERTGGLEAIQRSTLENIAMVSKEKRRLERMAAELWLPEQRLQAPRQGRISPPPANHALTIAQSKKVAMDIHIQTTVYARQTKIRRSVISARPM